MLSLFLSPSFSPWLRTIRCIRRRAHYKTGEYKRQRWVETDPPTWSSTEQASSSHPAGNLLSSYFNISRNSANTAVFPILLFLLFFSFFFLVCFVSFRFVSIPFLRFYFSFFFFPCSLIFSFPSLSPSVFATSARGTSSRYVTVVYLVLSRRRCLRAVIKNFLPSDTYSLSLFVLRVGNRR